MAILIIAIVSFISCQKEIKDNVPNLTPLVLNTNGLPDMIIPANNPLTEEAVALGRKLFWDPILSANNTQSCGTCHNPSFAFVDSTNQFSKGIDGFFGNRNSMPLINLGYSETLFWDGRANSLEEQALGPIQNPIEMHNTLENMVHHLKADIKYPLDFYKVFGTAEITPEMVAKVLASFERTMISNNSKFDKYQRGEINLSAEETRGMNLFVDMNKGDCNHCHTLGANFSDFEFRNTGLDSIPIDLGRFEVTKNNDDKGKMKTPTLRNIALTAPYMHDGRFATLFQCIEHYNKNFKYTENLDANLEHSIKGRMSYDEINDIIAFLNTLTDYDFINNKNFKKEN
ncbi:MAG: c-type cytochrome [Chitinophagaceae bacterium]|nr:c-type cytochrome [Chitinophagaceae bacterium]